VQTSQASDSGNVLVHHIVSVFLSQFELEMRIRSRVIQSMGDLAVITGERAICCRLAAESWESG
jgi:hypothetical protein